MGPRMVDKYEKIRVQENAIYESIAHIAIPSTKSSGNLVFDRALDWLCQEAECVIDFGCGNGTLLFHCFLRGTKRHIGIDISDSAIRLAEKRKALIQNGAFCFLHGGIEKLGELQNAFADAAILSNIIDNLYPDDAKELLMQMHRIIKPNGKVLAKVNPYLEKDQIQKRGMTVIQDNLLDDDGFYLWNNTTEEWNALFSEYFTIVDYNEIYYPEHNMYNRMFLLTHNGPLTSAKDVP